MLNYLSTSKRPLLLLFVSCIMISGPLKAVINQLWGWTVKRCLFLQLLEMIVIVVHIVIVHMYTT